MLGQKEAVTVYGVLLMTGIGVTLDYLEAKKWFRKGIHLGDMVRKYQLRILEYN